MPAGAKPLAKGASDKKEDASQRDAAAASDSGEKTQDADSAVAPESASNAQANVACDMPVPARIAFVAGAVGVTGPRRRVCGWRSRAVTRRFDMADEKKPIRAGSSADETEMSCRDVVMGGPAEDGRVTDRSDHRRGRAQLAIAGASLVLVLGSVGYFALNPDAMSMGGGAISTQTGSNSDGGASDAELDAGAFVAPDATPVENSSEDSGRPIFQHLG